MLSDSLFDRTRRIALDLAGIELHERHQALLGHRSRRLGKSDDFQLDSLLNAVERGESEATEQFLRLVTTQFSGFFRHPQHFDIASEHALWAAHRRGHVRLWCAASAKGEEPYSLAMALMEMFG